MPQPEEVAALTASLREAYEAAQAWLDEQEASIVGDPRQWRRRARLAQLRGEVAERMSTLDTQARTYFETGFPRAWELGATDAASTLGGRYSWTRGDVDAMTVMAREGFDDLLAATRHVNDTTKALIRRLARERALLALTAAQTPREASTALRRLLDRYGIRAVTYANGARHTIGDYADMIIRTRTATAYNIAGLRQSQRMGVRYVEVFDGTGDPACASVNGTVQTVEWGMANPLAHPRCQRSLSPAPWVTTDEGARSAAPSTTAAQRMDQAASEQARADATRRRANRRARQRRSAVRT